MRTGPGAHRWAWRAREGFPVLGSMTSMTGGSPDPPAPRSAKAARGGPASLPAPTALSMPRESRHVRPRGGRAGISPCPLLANGWIHAVRGTTGYRFGFGRTARSCQPSGGRGRSRQDARHRPSPAGRGVILSESVPATTRGPRLRRGESRRSTGAALRDGARRLAVIAAHARQDAPRRLAHVRRSGSPARGKAAGRAQAGTLATRPQELPEAIPLEWTHPMT